MIHVWQDTDQFEFKFAYFAVLIGRRNLLSDSTGRLKIKLQSPRNAILLYKAMLTKKLYYAPSAKC